MGRTRFSGPVYGAKSLLLSGTADLAQSTVVADVAAALVPVSEDWVITEFQVFRRSTQSTAFYARVLDDSTVVSSVAITSSAAGVLGRWLSTADAGEHEGVVIAAGSSVVLQAHPGTSNAASSGVVLNLYGYVRYRESSRFSG